MALGLMSAGIGTVPAKQTYLDISQGNRVDPVLYDGPPLGGWASLRSRAESAPADIVPGLLGTTLQRARIARRAAGDAGSAALLGVNEAGEIPEARRGCDVGRVDRAIRGKVDQGRTCRGMTIVAATVAHTRALARRLRGPDLLVAFAAPPPRPEYALAIGIAGRGFGGELASDSTHTDGLVVSTDLAPTILERLDVRVPAAMDGQPITSSGGAAPPATLTSLDDRIAAVPDRRPLTLGIPLIAWTLLAAGAGVAFGARGLRASVPLLACAIATLPAVLLLGALIEPSATVELLLVGLGSPGLAMVSVALAGAWGGLALAAALTVGGYAIAAVADPSVIGLSLMGPDPAHGARFYGIGNELETFAAALVPIGVGAAATAWRAGARPRAVAAAFAAAALVVAAAFAPGSFGADVGAVIDLVVGAVIAALVCLRTGSRRSAAAWAIAAALTALGALALVDLASGGGSHLVRSVLEAGGLDNLAQVAERRLELSAHNFSSYATSPALWAAVALIAAGVVQRRRIAGWFAGSRYAWAGFLGASGGVVCAVLANDSGALALMIGTALLTLAAGVAWAARSVTSAGLSG